MRIAVAGLFVSLVAFAAGCTPSPEKVCDKMLDLAKKDKEDEGGKSLTKERDECVDKAKETKAKKPELYKCVSKCVMDSSSLKGARGCQRSCK